MAAAAERENAFQHRSGPLTGLGRELPPGDRAPDAELVGKDFIPEPVRISDFWGSVLSRAPCPRWTPNLRSRDAALGARATRPRRRGGNAHGQHGPALRAAALVRRRRGRAHDRLGLPPPPARHRLRRHLEGEGPPGPRAVS